MSACKSNLVLWKFIFLLFLAAMIHADHLRASYPPGIFSKADKIIKNSWNSNSAMSRHPVVSEYWGEHKTPFDTLFSVEGEDHNNKGFLVISSAKGRYDRFDYAVLYNTDLTIREIEILVYRSQYGNQIMSGKWLGQFTGNLPEYAYSYGENVDALSGATFSAGSLTSEINRLNILMRSVLAKLPMKKAAPD